MEKLFPPLVIKATRDEVAKVYITALIVKSRAVLATLVLILRGIYMFGEYSGTEQPWLRFTVSTTALLTVSLGCGGVTI